MQGAHPHIAACHWNLSHDTLRDRSISRDARDPGNTERTPARNYPGGVQTTDSEVGPREVCVNPLQPFQSHDVWSSDKTLQALTRHVHSQLLPSDIDEEDEDSEAHHVSEQLPPCSVESAITHVAIRVNYGADSMPNQAKVPAHLCIWRWEVDEQNFHWLPKATRDKLKNRLCERRQVCTFRFSGATSILSVSGQG